MNKLIERCETCSHWQRGYMLQGSRIPSFCGKHFHSQKGDDPACVSYRNLTQETPHD